MKSKEELNALKNEVETMNKKLAELSVDEMKEVAGGLAFVPMICDTCDWQVVWSGYYPGMFECPKCHNITFHAK